MDYQLLGPSGLRVSQLCLGTMMFGGSASKEAAPETAQTIFKAFADAGGNFIDTANIYTAGQAERCTGDFIRHDRYRYVVGTKYTLYNRLNDPNASGNHRKNMMQSVHESLKRLRTDYIDLLWIHAWDFTTRAEEVMRGLDDLVCQGKVLYLGVSDTPAWIVARSQMMAELRGWSSFAAVQFEYSLIERTPDRELIPMANSLGLSITPWAVLGGGMLTGKYLTENGQPKRLSPDSRRLSEKKLEIAKVVSDIATEMGVRPSQVATAWCLGRSSRMTPIVGVRTLEQWEENLGSLEVRLDAATLDRLNRASEVDLGFPYAFLETDIVKEVVYGGGRHRLADPPDGPRF